MSTNRSGCCTDDPATPPPLTRKDFQSGQEVKWCPGCGAFGVLSQVQNVLPRLGIPRENFVFVSGIGCSSRFPYYLNTYGVHGIHGRAPAIAMGVKAARPDLSVWVVTGDGDGLSIGTNHLVHCMRRNVDLTILLLNNQIYGLTKGQYSPTSELGKRSKSSPMGSIEPPINPVALAIASGASFVARCVVTDQAHLGSVLEAGARHRGTSFIEIRMNCVAFNDTVLEGFLDRSRRQEEWVYLEPDKPLRYGKDGSRGLLLNGAHPETVTVGEGGSSVEDLMVHDAGSPSSAQAFMLATMEQPAFPTALGIFRQVERPTYDALLMEQVRGAMARGGPATGAAADLAGLLQAGTTWDVE